MMGRPARPLALEPQQQGQRLAVQALAQMEVGWVESTAVEFQSKEIEPMGQAWVQRE